MSKVIIHNLGPIKHVDIDLNKINVIMGPQSSGKSTIAKVISYCQWVEKRYLLDGEFKYEFTDQFLKFHRIDENYFNERSLIKYESEFVSITYRGTNYKQTIKDNQDRINYRKSKNIYIPAERNFVSVIPNLGKFNELNDNIMSFLYDWYDAKKKYPKKKPLSILNLGIRYHHIAKSDTDILTLSKPKKEIALRTASSGLQSVIPLIMLIDFLSEGFYTEPSATSVREANEIRNLLFHNFSHIIEGLDRLTDIKKSVENEEDVLLTKGEVEKLVQLLERRSNYHYSSLIIEEPEQNLFPKTQRDIVYYLLAKINSSPRNHKALLTTHSPYILYALNNCMMGYNVKDRMPKEIQQELLSKDSWIDPELVSVWEIRDGEITSIKDKDSGTVSKHYFNGIMNEIMDEYYEMLNYFDYEDKN